MSAKQIKYFGTTRQKNALKRKRNSAKRVTKRVRRSPNPALLITLGSAANPQRKRRKVTVARKKARRKVNPKRRRRSVMAAPVRRRRRVVRAANPRRRRAVRRNPARRTRRYARRNPNIFTGENAKLVMGGLVGITATKVLAKMIPASITQMGGSFGPLLANAVAAFAVSMAAGKLGLPGKVAEGVTFGGLMIVGSGVLNYIAPGLSISGQSFGINGLGELMPGSFVVPQNPLRLPPAPVPTNSRVTVSGLGRAFGTAF
jgi:hypothetical protein